VIKLKSLLDSEVKKNSKKNDYETGFLTLIAMFASCRRIFLFSFLACLFSSVLYAGNLDTKGKKWLESHTDPAEVNVTGVWMSKEWGNITLDQPQGSGKISGDGDQRRIDGIVSGKKVYLLFSYARDIEYSAVLNFESENTLEGTYSQYLKNKPDDVEISLRKRSPQIVRPASAEDNETARIIVYKRSARHFEPSIYLGIRQLAWLEKGYFSFRVEPGVHRILIWIRTYRWSHSQTINMKKSVNVDARAGETYFLEVEDTEHNYRYSGEIKLASEEEARKDIKELEPLESEYVVADSIVLLDKIPVE
jgi:hypothetical protein